MILDDFYIVTSQPAQPRTFMEQVREICEQVEPKPIFCEIPEDLKLRSVEASGTIQTYTVTSSMMSLTSNYGTSTTTTP